MLCALVCCLLVTWLHACTAPKLELHDISSYRRELLAVSQDLVIKSMGAGLIKMSLPVKDGIGAQKFGHLIEAIDTMPPKLRILAFRELLTYYHYCFGSLPSSKIMTSFLDRQEFREATHGSVLRLRFVAPEYARHQSLKPRNLVDLENNAQKIIKFMSHFAKTPEAFRDQIDLLFPIPTSYEDALRDALTDILLIQRTMSARIKKEFSLINTIFQSPKTELFTTSAQDFLAERIMWCFISKHISNKILRKLDAGLRTGDREAVIQAYAFAKKLSFTDENHSLPALSSVILNSLTFGREREFAKWKLTLMSVKVADLVEDLTPKGWVMMKTLYHTLMARIALSLQNFLPDENDQTCENRTDAFVKVVSKFDRVAMANCVKPSSKPKQARDFFQDKINREIPEILKKDPDYADFMDLDAEHMNALLKAIRECDAPPQEFMDFGGEAIVERGKIASSESSSKRIDEKRAKRAKKKRLAKLARKIEPTRTHSKQKDRAAPSEPITDPNPLDEMAVHLDESLYIDMESEIEDKALGKEEASEDSGSSNSVEDGSDSEHSIPEDDHEDDRAKIAEEWKQIEEEQLRVIEHYKFLAKLEKAKLRHNKIKFQMESKIKKEKPRIVASFRTEEFKFLNSKARQLFIDNQEVETALAILNSRKKSAKFRWVFNPSVEIDLDAYIFLCELFGLSDSTNYLTYKNFIRTFQKLNPTKAKLSKKELSRSVFQFEHAFETEDEVFIPPIGGCHKEHLSSNFNHIQIRQFMTHGGAHPYFFELLK